jgi:hypothetical protein
LAETVLEIREEKYPRDLARVVAEQETSYRGDDPEDQGFGAAVGAIDADGSGSGGG